MNRNVQKTLSIYFPDHFLAFHKIEQIDDAFTILIATSPSPCDGWKLKQMRCQRRLPSADTYLFSSCLLGPCAPKYSWCQLLQGLSSLLPQPPVSAPISTPAGLAPLSCANTGPGCSMFLSHHSPCSKFTKAAFQLLLNQWIYPRNVMNNYTLSLPLSLLRVGHSKKIAIALRWIRKYKCT